VTETLDHRTLAATTYNRCWAIIDENDTSESAKVEILTCAFASKWHWQHAGGPQQWVISDWMVSRAAGHAGELALCLQYAQRAVDAATGDLPDWLQASAAEGLARAYALAGDAARRDEWLLRAADLVAKIEDPDDQSIIAEQLASVPR
jgi:hypothetical protein